MELGAKITVIVFMEETWWPSSNTLSECYNNVDVGVPLWLNEPRDKHPRQECAISYPALYASVFYTSNLCAFSFIEQFLDRKGYRLLNSFGIGVSY